MNLTELNNSQLGLISYKDLKDPIEDLTENERREYVALITSVFSILKKEIEHAIVMQGDLAIRLSESWEGVLIARGGINMGAVLMERFTALKSEHLSNIKPQDSFDKYDVV